MNVFSNVKYKLVIASTSLLLSASTFAAEGDTATNYATEAMNSLKAQATELIAQTWPVVTVVVGAGLAIRLFKKFSSKAV
ncbi:capsid protein [Salmonella enterica]|uniref:Capsid protein n=1 Tax=Salmonella enterica TaxID=28901 RepID=A0A5Y6EMI7_SALER|nr:major coat protein [Salmonella enterica]EAA7364334.1 capsid protein [Salmonella enterica subsp. enterica]ECM5338282.1 capsid protein [Salmonella enterica subsp. enterica serovar Give]EDB9083010.1 capsid protein [Salmonella enterica subsp. enterica serovar Newport]EAO5073288.1 capsid protein [Salmonella enterica]EAQ7627411.1 capsid protein [Salmonella enterica]